MNKFVAKIKDFLTFGPVSAVLAVNKHPSLKDTELTGTLVMTPKQNIGVIKVTYELVETFEQVKSTKVDLSTYVLGTLEYAQPLALKQLEVTSLPFAIPFTIDKWSQGDKAVYTWDLGLMNRYSDMAKQKSSSYKLAATITFDTWKEMSTHTSITFQQQDDKDIG